MTFKEIKASIWSKIIPGLVIALVMGWIGGLASLGQYKERVDTNKTDITALKAQVKEDHDTLKTVEGDLKAIKEKIATLEKNQEKMDDKLDRVIDILTNQKKK